MTVKKRSDPDWEDVRVFSALARFGTLSATARALGVNHVTIARRIAKLEATLGIKLFQRRADGFRLTAQAVPELDRARRMEEAAALLGRDVGDPATAGLIRITATASLIDAFLLPICRQLVETYPGIDLDVVADRRALSLARYETDIALRLNRPEDGEMIARKVADVAYGAYGTIAWSRRIAAGETAELIGFDEQNADVPEAIWVAQTFPSARLRMRLGSHFSQASACALGAGVAVLPRYIARLHAGLLEIDVGKAPPQRALWLLTRSDVKTAPQIRAATDFLVQAFSEARGLFNADEAAARRPQGNGS